ncbi:MAG: electron transfer flavoprotein subunit alpha/FixB family protein [Betaproteobacteria bacterium]|nr:electron transfer flavoprotein subunit alpha/FixB family protein [Betaproteobacteria bacterium]
MTVLVIVEHADNKLATASFEQLALARGIAGKQNVIALLIGGERPVAQTLLARGADSVIVGSAAVFNGYNSDGWVTCAAQVVREHNASLVLAAHTPSGADLAPRLAFRLNAGCATGCVKIENNNGTLLFTRAAHGGNVRETLHFKTDTAVATVRAGVYDALPADTTRRGEIVELSDAPASRIRVIERKREDSAGLRLEDAKVIIAGGRGINGPEGFEVLKPLAELLGGVVGASRVPCDLGWCSHAMQIGLTGKTVTPELYIAVGISGASHHLAGCGNAKTIVAINTDKDAAIFREAKFGVVGDFAKVVPALTAAISALPKTI